MGVKPDTMREEHRLKVSENMALRKISGSYRNKVTRDWKKLQIVRVMICTHHPNIIRATKSKKSEIQWAHIIHGGRKDACKVLVGQPDRKRPLGRFDHKCKNI